MRTILLFCLCAFVLCACGNNKAKQLEQRKQAIADSIAQVERQRKEMIERARIDSLSTVAWGDLRFGMSQKDALKTVSLKNGDVDDNTISMDFNTRFALENAFGMRELGYFDVTFEENELSFITIKSYKVDASHIDDLVNDCKILADNFSKKMGEPIMSYDEEINVFTFNEGKMFIYAQYCIGGKCVLIRMGEIYSCCEYYYEVYISNSDYPKKKHEPTPEEKARMKKEEEESQLIISNSF